MDWIDIVAGRANQTYSGRYYASLPAPDINESSNAPKLFDYEYVDVTERRYQMLIGNLLDTDMADATVKTRSPIKLEVNKHVVLQDGNLYAITSVTLDPRSVPVEAARVSIFPPAMDKILRLRQKEDLWGIGGASG